MYSYLDLRVDPDHSIVQFGVVLHQCARLPRSRHEYRVDAAAKRCCEDVADLQADKKCEGYDNCCTQS